MLDLNFILPGALRRARADVEPGGLDDAYQRYLTGQQQCFPEGMPMSRDDFERYSLGSGWLSGFREAAKKVVQTCRLMVGVHDYEYYLEHMRTRHPEAVPLSREDFYRYCLEARFPGKGNINRCPC